MFHILKGFVTNFSCIPASQSVISPLPVPTVQKRDYVKYKKEEVVYLFSRRSMVKIMMDTESYREAMYDEKDENPCL